MKKITQLLKFLVSNFGPIAVFYGTNNFWGLRAAVIATSVWSIGEILVYKFQGKPITTFFKFSAGITILFGLVDIYFQQSILFKYEAAVTSLVFGIYFASTLFKEKTLIQEFAELQGRVSSQISADGRFYFSFITGVWAMYFWIKALAYAWIAGNYSIGESLLIRGTVGNLSFYAMLLVSMFGVKPIKASLAMMRLLPSSRIKV